MLKPEFRNLLVEALGTFFLCYLGGISVYTASYKNDELSTSPYPTNLTNIMVAHGGILFIIIVWGGPISGAHVNPAVSVALMAIGECPPIKGGLYIAAQFVGSLLAGAAMKMTMPSGGVKDAKGDIQPIYHSPLLDSRVSSVQGFFLEFFGTMCLLIAILTAVRTT